MAPSSGHASVPLEAVWASTARASEFFADGGMNVEQATGPTDRIVLNSRGGRAWYGFLRLLDEDAVDRVRHYRLTARSEADRLSGDIAVRLASEGAQATRVDVECTFRSTTAHWPDAREVADSWRDAICRHSSTWARDAASPDQPGLVSSGATTDRSRAADALGHWMPPVLGLVLGLATGAGLRRLGHRTERKRP